MQDYNEDSVQFIEEDLENWVMNKVDNWREFFETNYDEKFDEYLSLIHI